MHARQPHIHKHNKETSEDPRRLEGASASNGMSQLQCIIFQLPVRVAQIGNSYWQYKDSWIQAAHCDHACLLLSAFAHTFSRSVSLTIKLHHLLGTIKHNCSANQIVMLGREAFSIAIHAVCNAGCSSLLLGVLTSLFIF